MSVPDGTKINPKFTTTNWSHKELESDAFSPMPGGILTARLEGKYEGDMEGTAISFYTMSRHEPKSGDEKDRCLKNSTWNGQQVFSGTVLGKKGTFCALDWGRNTDGRAEGNYRIITATATGELTGIKGGGIYFVPSIMSDEPVTMHMCVEMP